MAAGGTTVGTQTSTPVGTTTTGTVTAPASGTTGVTTSTRARTMAPGHTKIDTSAEKKAPGQQPPATTEPQQ